MVDRRKPHMALIGWMSQLVSATDTLCGLVIYVMSVREGLYWLTKFKVMVSISYKVQMEKETNQSQDFKRVVHNSELNCELFINSKSVLSLNLIQLASRGSEVANNCKIKINWNLNKLFVFYFNLKSQDTLWMMFWQCLVLKYWNFGWMDGWMVQ